jgi:hypothetical protein
LQVPGLVPTRPAELSEDKTHGEQAYPAITDIRADIALRRFGSEAAQSTEATGLAMSGLLPKLT